MRGTEGTGKDTKEGRSEGRKEGNCLPLDIVGTDILNPNY